jgi:hypothetical protein
MAAGGRDNGAPGIRAHYHPNYYGAFVLDPDGHNIEAFATAGVTGSCRFDCPACAGTSPPSPPLSLPWADPTGETGK